jgi:DNA-binding MarR family transcriptional regulator
MNIIVHLSHYWWRPENLPHPSVATIAKAIGVEPRTIQKRIKALEAADLIKREERRHTKTGSTTNLYSFGGLIKAALPYAEEKLAEIAAAQEAKKKRLERKKPKLVVNNEA